MQITNSIRCLAAVAVAALALLASGCGGGGSGNGVARLSTTTTSSDTTSSASSGNKAADARAYSACMRKNGVPSFPDPSSRGALTLRAGPGTGINPNSAQFRRAQSKCARYLPNGGKVDPAAQAKIVQAALKFSQCMRAHGIRNFPDPQVSGGAIGLRLNRAAGMDPQSPLFRSAQRACQKQLPGPKGGAGFTTQGSGKP